MGGGNEPENIVELTAEEHYVAHQILVKLHPGCASLVTAFYLMAKCSGNKAYGWLRRKHAATTSVRNLGNKYNLGKKHSIETRWKIAKSALGNTHTLGQKRTPESRAKMSKVQSGKKLKPFSAEQCANMAAALIGRKCSPETRAKISAAHLGMKASLETRAKISAVQKGKPWTEARRAAFRRGAGRASPPRLDLPQAAA